MNIFYWLNNINKKSIIRIKQNGKFDWFLLYLIISIIRNSIIILSNNQ
jgi:hypothetical protein